MPLGENKFEGKIRKYTIASGFKLSRIRKKRYVIPLIFMIGLVISTINI